MINNRKHKTKNLIGYLRIYYNYNTVRRPVVNPLVSRDSMFLLQTPVAKTATDRLRTSASKKLDVLVENVESHGCHKVFARRKASFTMRSIPLNKNESVTEYHKKHSIEIQKNAHYYYYILCRRQIQLSTHSKLNKKNLLTSGEIEQKASHSFKDSMEKKNFGLPQTTKPVTSLM